MTKHLFNKSGRQFVHIAILLGFFLGLIEVTAYVTGSLLRYQLFSFEDEFDKLANSQDFANYISSPYFDPVLGWNNPTKPTERVQANCLDQQIHYHYRDGYRISSLAPGDERTVFLFGDSYAHGDEVADEATIASSMWSSHGIPAINYGVPGFGTDQAVGKFKQTVHLIHTGQTAVLLIQHENIRRVVNSLRPVYSPPSLLYSLKPYVSHGKQIDLRYPRDFSAFMAAAHRLFVDDYWAKPRLEFPYSLSLLRSLFTKNFMTIVWSTFVQRFGYEFEIDQELRQDILFVIEDFLQTAQKNDIRPVVIFIPINRSSYRVSSELVENINRHAGRSVAFEFVDDGMDWGKYNLKPNGDCHPSPYGYARIGDFIVQKLTDAAAKNRPVALSE